jgi:uncharacterized protein
MTTDHIRYDILAQDALRGVVRTVMADAAKKGLLGEHHFKISFDTTAPGIKLSPRLREQYPLEMTIVLQHQFWDLTVSDEAFEVGLSFNGIPERLRVPFDAIVGFFDPSVEFGLQFATIVEEEDSDAATPGHEPSAGKPAGGRPPSSVPAVPDTSQPPVREREQDEIADKPATGAEVVRLDRFRKK